MRGQETQARVDAVNEGLNLLLITEYHAALPVRRYRSEVDDLDVTDGVDDLGGFGGRNLAHGTPLENVVLRKFQSTFSPLTRHEGAARTKIAPHRVYGRGVLECVMNISEGRDLAVLELLSTSAGPSLRDCHSDTFHNRSVFTLINTTAELLRDVRSLVNASLRLLDLERHEGVHPRLGVVDVVPFVALSPDTPASAVRLRDLTARWIATTHEVPVFLYGPLSTGERTLPYVRANAFNGLAPDFGPPHADAHLGAVVVGARDILVAWNLWLTVVSLERAHLLAQLVRRPGVRALGLQVGEEVQVSCNFVDLALATPSQVYDQVAAHVPADGVIERAELVGLMPQALLDSEDPVRWAQLGLSEDATIESRLALQSRTNGTDQD